MAAIDRIGQLEARRHFYLLTAILGKFYAQLGHCEAAQNHWQFALGLAPSRAERDLLEKRQENLVMGPSAGISPGCNKAVPAGGPAIDHASRAPMIAAQKAAFSIGAKNWIARRLGACYILKSLGCQILCGIRLARLNSGHKSGKVGRQHRTRPTISRMPVYG